MTFNVKYLENGTIYGYTYNGRLIRSRIMMSRMVAFSMNLDDPNQYFTQGRPYCSLLNI